LPLLEEGWIEECFRVMFVQHFHQRRQKIYHGVVVVEYRRSVAAPYFFPDVLRVFAN
jgi:hypothetical protein